MATVLGSQEQFSAHGQVAEDFFYVLARAILVRHPQAPNLDLARTFQAQASLQYRLPALSQECVDTRVRASIQHLAA